MRHAVRGPCGCSKRRGVEEVEKVEAQVMTNEGETRCARMANSFKEHTICLTLGLRLNLAPHARTYCVCNVCPVRCTVYMMWDQRRSRHHIKPPFVQNVPTLRTMMEVDVAARFNILKECMDVAFTFTERAQIFAVVVSHLLQECAVRMWWEITTRTSAPTSGSYCTRCQ